jgi:hypothetical protein
MPQISACARFQWKTPKIIVLLYRLHLSARQVRLESKFSLCFQCTALTKTLVVAVVSSFIASGADVGNDIKIEHETNRTRSSAIPGYWL